MTVIDSIQSCVDLQVPANLPVFALSEQFDARYAGLTYGEYISDAETIIDTQLLAIERFGWDWAWLHLDDTLEFEPLGVEVATGEDQVPAVVGHLPFDRRTVRSLEVPDPGRAGRMPLLLDALTGLRQVRGDDTCVTGRVMAPFSAVTLTYGNRAIQAAMGEAPVLMREALAAALEQAVSYGVAQVAAGAHAIWISDQSASTHFLSPDQYQRWALEPCLEICRALRETGAFVFLHTADARLEGLRLQAQTDPSVLAVGPGIEMSRVKAALGRQATMGNSDPIGMLLRGSASVVAADTDRQVRVAAAGGMILNSGDIIPRAAKGPNLHTMIDTAKKIWDILHPRA